MKHMGGEENVQQGMWRGEDGEEHWAATSANENDVGEGRIEVGNNELDDCHKHMSISR